MNTTSCAAGDFWTLIAPNGNELKLTAEDLRRVVKDMFPSPPVASDKMRMAMSSDALRLLLREEIRAALIEHDNESE